ncbi:hypothetical protein PPERSA_10188 [Pseudocohnilembus persalinus]|uniref:Transmembrane protein n=1 Tax=Pseudocohnilembus persalinus TaxID=266149 RepID=A0A0V0QL97_PSEPJ|nr:hypothetical protein PPERSA_10188 [Pseudocohnilembus persalinus]|eukprot:KRX03107.1 hypothetical protein PPERSA_10188 [Pseudocohnilembus persalinus]
MIILIIIIQFYIILGILIIILLIIYSVQQSTKNHLQQEKLSPIKLTEIRKQRYQQEQIVGKMAQQLHKICVDNQKLEKFSKLNKYKEFYEWDLQNRKNQERQQKQKELQKMDAENNYKEKIMKEQLKQQELERNIAYLEMDQQFASQQLQEAQMESQADIKNYYIETKQGFNVETASLQGFMKNTSKPTPLNKLKNIGVLKNQEKYSKFVSDPTIMSPTLESKKSIQMINKNYYNIILNIYMYLCIGIQIY